MMRSPLSISLENLHQILTNSVFTVCKAPAVQLLLLFHMDIAPKSSHYKSSVKNLMHPFYFGIQKYEGQRPTCHPKPTYLPIVWITALKITC